ncbi:MAG TPA: GNAT family N-acyltransferase [Humisphaera sp.]
MRPDRLLKLDLPPESLLGRAVRGRAQASLERVTGLAEVNALYDRARALGPVAAGPEGSREFLRRLLADAGVRVTVSPEDLARIPKKGPLVVVANHPFGALDGMILASMLAEARPDTKVMANYLLGRIPELRDLFVLVDPFGGAGAAARNAGPMRVSLRWLKDGHVLAAFPAGGVAHATWTGFRNPEGLVTDPAWNETIARIARRAGVPVLPVYFDGRNDVFFQVAGLIHPILRTGLLARAFLRMRGRTVTLRVGSPVPAKRAAGFETERELTDYLRRRTFLLRHGVPKPSIASADATPAACGSPPCRKRPLLNALLGAVRAVRAWAKPPAPAAVHEPIVDPVDPALLEADLAALPPDSLLLEHEGMRVYQARAGEIRHVLREIGRLREVTFRQVGEGTGKAIDLDTFDYDYSHLFVWDAGARKVVGAYRLGQTDRLLPAKGRQGLYTSTLFNYDAELLRRLNPALEMGRSFVRAEYQRSFAPLLLLWKGIGHFVVRHPQYRYLLGPVSISNSYQTVSRQLMVRFLTMHHAMPDGESLAQPKHPFRPKRPVRLGSGRWDDDGIRRLLRDDEEVSSLISDLEPDQKGIPVLIRQYLKLGAKFLAFNVDRDFGDCLDGLIVIDLLHTEPRVLERYMTKSGYAEFVRHQQGLVAASVSNAVS